MGVDYISRAIWGARHPRAKTILVPSQIEGIFVHHAVTPTAPEIQMLQQIQNFHMDGRGWNDIAYNWLVGQSGNIYEGRGWLVNGGHTEGHNFTSHAVCFIGNSDSDVPSAAALRSIETVIQESLSRFGGFVKPHGAVNSTGCPGSWLTNWVASGRPLEGSAPSLPIFVPEEDDMASTWHRWVHEHQQAQYAVLQQGGAYVGKTWLHPDHVGLYISGNMGPFDGSDDFAFNAPRLDALPWLGDAPLWADSGEQAILQAAKNIPADVWAKLKESLV